MMLPFRKLCFLLYLSLISGGASADHINFKDNAPVKWSGTAPHRYPVHGIDVARFQNDINWRSARQAGVRFVFMKATEGGDLLDPKFKENWREAKRAGVRRGAYHFYYFCTSPEVQARWFIENVPKSKGALPPVLDMEWNPFSPTCQKRPPAKEVRQLMRRFMDIIEHHYDQRPVIYSTPRFFRENELETMTEEFWLRTTVKTPSQAYPGQNWRFWQYSSTGLIPGIEKEVDLNLFNGTQTEWERWLKARQR